jgi:hypothetical protein
MLRQGGRVTAPLDVIAAKEIEKRGHERNASPQIGMDEGIFQNRVGGGQGLPSQPIICRQTCRQRQSRAYGGGNEIFQHVVFFFSILPSILIYFFTLKK